MKIGVYFLNILEYLNDLSINYITHIKHYPTDSKKNKNKAFEDIFSKFVNKLRSQQINVCSEIIYFKSWDKLHQLKFRLLFII